MTFQQSISTVLHKYCDFNGRASRSEFWWWVLFTTLISIVLNLIGGCISGFNGHQPLVITIIGYALGIFFLLPSLGVAVRRLHDIGKGGGWIFINCVPAIGNIWFFVLTVLASEPYDNRFGPVPQ